MSDEIQGAGASGLSSQDEGSGGSPDAETKKGTRPWVWIVLAVVAIMLLLGLYATQTPQGQLWILGLRSMAPVPNVIGQTQSQAQTTLQGAGFSLGEVSQEPTLVAPPGIVIAQQPTSSTAAKKDSAVDVVVSAIPSVKVPDVVGESQSNAVTLLAEQGLRTGTITYVYDSKTTAGSVKAQEPAATTEISVGAAVDLSVSKGTQEGQVPNVIGLSQDDANSVIMAAGFKVTIVKATTTSVPPGDVISQSPAAGVVAPTGSTVTITVSTGAPAAAAAAQPPSTPAETTPPPPSTPAATTPPKPSSPTTTPPKPSKPVPSLVKVPDVVGMRVLEAVRALRKAELKVSFEFAPSTTSILKVTTQDPAAGASVDPGTTVIITISLPSLSLPEGKPTKPTPLPAEQPTLQPTPTPQPAPAPQPVPAPAPQPKPSAPSSPTPGP